MDLENPFEDEENCAAKHLLLRSLTTEDFIRLVEEIIRNEKIEDGTSLCFQIFCNIMSKSIRDETLNEDYSQLNIISKCVEHLKKVNKFDTYKFVDFLLNEFITIPLEVVWWLHKNEIMYFSQYCDIWKPPDLVNDMLKLLKSNKQHKIFVTSEIMQDLLTELLRGCYRPNIGICRLHRSNIWSVYCYQILNDLVEETLRTVLKGTGEPFVNFLPFVLNSRKFLPSIIMGRFYKNILNKLMVYNVEEFDVYSSYTYQQLWCSEKIDNNLLILYNEIFTKYCDMKSILEIMEEHDEKINWKFTLAAVGVCVQKSPTGNVDIRNVTMRFLNESFRGGKIRQFIMAILFVRQGCMEENMKIDYRSWYSSTFGTKSDFKTTKNTSLFKFLMNTLSKLIPYEPKSYLKIHIEQALTAPRQCNSLIHDYKDLCRIRLEELRKSPRILMGGVETAVLHMVEESVRNKRISSVMIDILLNQHENFYNIILPQILRNKMPFIEVKALLLKEKYLTNEMIHFSSVDDDNMIFDDDDDFVKH